LFSTSKEDEMKEWIVKINFHAKLAPAQQLTSYDRAKQALAGEQRPQAPISQPPAGSPQPSSRENTPSRRHTVAVGLVTPDVPSLDDGR
jgi:hypothetical protein